MTLKRPYQILLLLFLVLGVYYPLLKAPFNSLDDLKLVDNLLNSKPSTLIGLLLPHGRGYYYRPLLYYTFVLDQPLWGLDQGFMHLENILWHALNAVLVYLIAGRVALKSGIATPGLALAAALLFALHPVNTEAVNWISGRSDLMAGSFVLLSIYLLLVSLERDLIPGAAAAVFSYLLACLCKETAVFFLPGALLMVHSYGAASGEPFRESLRRTWRRWPFWLPFLAAAIGYLSLRQAALQRPGSAVALSAKSVVGGVLPQGVRPWDIVKAVGYYAKMLVAPWPLNFATVHVPGYCLVAGLLLPFCLVYLARRRDLVSAFFLAAAGIASSALLVLLIRMAWTPIAERYLYIASAVFVIALTVAACRKAAEQGRERALALAFLPVLGLATWGTVQRNLVWQDNLALFEDTVRKSPDFVPAKNELAVALHQHGRFAEGNRVLKANRADKSLKNSEVAIVNMAGAMADAGDPKGARALLVGALDPKSVNNELVLRKLVDLGFRRVQSAKDPVQAAAERRELAGFLQSLAELTGDPFYWYRIGQNYLALGETRLARDSFAKAYATAPADAHYRQPAKALADRLSAGLGAAR